ACESRRCHPPRCHQSDETALPTPIKPTRCSTRPLKKIFRLADASSMIAIENRRSNSMAPQFIHIEAYGREGAHKKNSSERKSSMFDVRDELVRASHACGHVALPKPPIIIFGDHPNTVMTLCAEQAARAIDKAGRKLRCDAPAVVAGV